MKLNYLPLFAAGLLAASSASAQVNIDTVFVGNAGNANDSTGYGAVNYGYHIGTYEVTNSQYATFLNSVAAADTYGLYNTGMAGTYGGISRSGSSGSYTYTAVNPDRPVNYVGFWDAARFTNWLTTGNTETGVYTLGGITNPINTITRDATVWQAGGVAIASENEWYKAAYYSGTPTGADGDGYSLYPTQSNSLTTAAANYANSVGNVAAVGSYVAAPSYYGTFDQGGNVWEWNDETANGSAIRVMRGGSFGNSGSILQSSLRADADPTLEGNFYGFRVSSLAAIPEPSAYAAIVGGLGLVLALWRRQGRRTL